jgi:hypothetical protein
MRPRHRPEDMVYKIVDMSGMVWDLRPDNPVPSGYVLDGGRLARLGPELTSPRTASASASQDFTASANALLAEAKAAGWKPTPATARCGACTTCRAGGGSCLRPLTGVAARVELDRRARLRADNEERELLAGRGWYPTGASGVSFVETDGERLAREHRLAELRERYGV